MAQAGHRAFGALAVALTGVVYFRATHGYFFADDFLFLVQLREQPIAEVLLSPFGGHMLVARNAVFAATFGLFGFDATPFAWSSYLTHLLNVWLLYRVLRALTARPALACLGATLWGTCPIHVASVGWYAVYGQELAATALLVVLVQLTEQAHRAPSLGRVAGWCGVLLVGATCFGVGLGVALVFPAIVLLLHPALVRRLDIAVTLLALPAAAAGLYRWLTWRAAAADTTALFEAIAFARAAPILAMLGHLVACGMTVLALGFFAGVEHWPYVATRYPGGGSHVVVAGTVVLLAAAWWGGGAAVRAQLLASAILVVGSYGIIALGRANFWTDNLAFWGSQSRYHYVGTIPLAMLLCIALGELGRRWPIASPGLLLATALAIAGIGWARTDWRIDTHAYARAWVTTALATIDAAIAARDAGTTVYVDNDVMPATVRGPVIPARDLPGRAVPFAIAHASDVVRGRRVRFVEPDPHVVAWHRRRGGRLGQLLVAPNEVAGAGP